VEVRLLAHLILLALVVLVDSRAVAVAVELLPVAALLVATVGLEAMVLFVFGGLCNESACY